MDLTPEALRSARFRDKLRGYHPEDVDAFLESVAEGLGVLLGRLRDTTERVRRLESGSAVSDAEESVRRTLVLAQRTADAAIAEARDQAAKLVAEAEARAAAITGAAQDTALATAERAQEQLRADLDRLQTARDQLSSDVRALEQWLGGERTRLKRALSELVDRVENVRGPEGAPTARPTDLPARPSRPALVTPSSRPPRPAPEPVPEAETEWESLPERAPEPSGRVFAPAPPPEPVVVNRTPRPPVSEPSPDPIPEPAPAPWVAPRSAPAADEPAAVSMTTTVTEASPERVGDNGDPDVAVLMRAQAATPARDEEPDDPYFAELRRAITDPQPLGPREDDDETFEASVEDIFDPQRTSRLRRRR